MSAVELEGDHVVPRPSFLRRFARCLEAHGPGLEVTDGGDLWAARIDKEGTRSGRRVDGNADVFDHETAEFGFDRGVGARWKGDRDEVVSFNRDGRREIEGTVAFDAIGPRDQRAAGFESVAAGGGKQSFGTHVRADEVGARTEAKTRVGGFSGRREVVNGKYD